jgi:hypothetical protein
MKHGRQDVVVASRQAGWRGVFRASPAQPEWELAANAAPPIAAHIVTSRLGYTHHGIYVGDGQVIHYSGLSRGWRGGPVEEVSLSGFAKGRRVRVRIHADARFGPEAVIARARSRLGENGYRTLTNNCEHLCQWCIEGENRSRQVELLYSRTLGALEAALRLLVTPLRVVMMLSRLSLADISRSAGTRGSPAATPAR